MEWAFCLVIPALAAVVFLAFSGGVGEPSGGSTPDYSGHRSRRTSDIENDERIIETAARLNQQRSGRELGNVPTVHYRPGCDYGTWANARWIAQHYPDKITGDIPCSDYDRQLQNERYYSGG